MKQSQTVGYALLGFFIGMGLLGAGYLTAQSLIKVKEANQTLSVKGYAEKKVVSDFAQWIGRVQATSMTEQGALEQIKQSHNRLNAYLVQSGFALESVDFSTYSISARYKINENGSTTNEVDHYHAEFTINLGSEDIDRITKFSKNVQDLIKEGVSFAYTNVNYLYRNIDALKISLLGAATRDAKTRAVELATNAGSTVGALRQARQGVFQVTAETDQSISDYGVFDTQSINKIVRAVVTMSFGVE